MAEVINFEIGPENEVQLLQKFKRFQIKYLAVYLTVMGADWLQGPYLYKLYDSYGLGLTHIAMLFLTGFISSAFAGTAVGSLADTCGRKRICIVFCFTMISALLLRLINQYMLLFFSHVLSGLSTALLYSVFESWYVSEHARYEFPAEWRARTFALATFFNSVVAIVAGVFANTLVNIWGFKAPYIASMLLVVLVGFMVTTTWSENYGSSRFRDVKLASTLKSGLLTVIQNRNITILSIAQTFFECSMYIFVLLYTPAVESVISSDAEIPLGYLFSTMMVAIMVGSMCFQLFERQAKTGPRCFLHFKEDRLLSMSLGLASCAFMLMAYFGDSSAIFLVLAYHVFEFSTGLYHPSISSLKAEAIPEETRAAVMTLLRIPMNLGVGIIMWHVDDLSTAMMFSICGVMTSIGCFIVIALYDK
ncbi:DUF791-domain-containing protein [Backusella circina FSU 941]|nr:DUF791-domain-containing protein [Backusella circina FSU 941]KAI8880165.1 DUF791-domain-containing protein [Backusella circina FSU 941]